MRRVASHYVYWNGLHRMHYVELSDEAQLNGVFPLVEEIAGTEFYDGILIPVAFAGNMEKVSGKISYPWNDDPAIRREQAVKSVLSSLNGRLAEVGEKVSLLSLQLSAAEFGTDNRCGYGYVKRL